MAYFDTSDFESAKRRDEWRRLRHKHLARRWARQWARQPRWMWLDLPVLAKDAEFRLDVKP